MQHVNIRGIWVLSMWELYSYITLATFLVNLKVFQRNHLFLKFSKFGNKYKSKDKRI